MEHQHELISALADGQLRDAEFARAVEAATADGAARQAWHTYHLIGDVLRSGQAAPATAPDLFMQRLSQRLAQEAPPLRPAAVGSLPAPAAPAGRQAANDESFRWKLVAGFASFAAVAALGWSVAGGLSAPQAQGQLAVVQPPDAGSTAKVASEGRGVMIRDPRLDEFLAAHRQHGGASALQMPAGFLRNATFEGASR